MRAPAQPEQHTSVVRAAPLTTLTLGAAAETRLTHEPLLSALQTALGAEHVLFYVATRTPTELHFIVRGCVGNAAAELRQAFEQLTISSGREPSVGHDPFAVPSAQQNTALSAQGLHALDPRVHARSLQLLASLGQGEQSFVRLLISDGPRLLGGVLALRPKPFAAHDATLLQARAAPLIAQLNRERAALLASSSRSLVQALLESFAEPALLLAPPGVVEFTNRAGIEWLNETDRADELAEMRAAMADPGQAAPPSLVMTSLNELCHGHYLVRLAHAARNSPTQVVALARRAWRLVDLQVQVLERVAHGQSNKEIAAALGRAEVTIERHLTRLFRVSGSHCRAELITRLYSLAP